MKVGDRVAIIGTYGVTAVLHIDRETKLYWYAKDWRFRKSDLRTPTGDWGQYYHIKQATQEHIDELRKRNLKYRLSKTDWSKLDLEALEKVFAVVCGMTDTKENKK